MTGGYFVELTDRWSFTASKQVRAGLYQFQIHLFSIFTPTSIYSLKFLYSTIRLVSYSQYPRPLRSESINMERKSVSRKGPNMEFNSLDWDGNRRAFEQEEPCFYLLFAPWSAGTMKLTSPQQIRVLTVTCVYMCIMNNLELSLFVPCE